MAAVDGWTTRKITRWLRCYRDWEAELATQPGAPSCTDYSSPVVQGGSAAFSGGPAPRYAERRQQLEEQVRTVDAWLASCSQVERLAADYWLLDKDGTIMAVAVAADLDYRRALWLVQTLPLLIWSRFYQPVEGSEQMREANA